MTLVLASFIGGGLIGGLTHVKNLPLPVAALLVITWAMIVATLVQRFQLP